MYKIRSKSAFVSVEIPLIMGSIEATVVHQLCIYEGEEPNMLVFDRDYVDIKHVTYNGIKIACYQRFCDLHIEMGIDIDQALNNMAEEILSDLECQKIADKMTCLLNK